MLISQSLNAAINEQIGNEFAASLQYVAIASYFESETLPQLAQYFFRQANEENEHAMRFVKYVNEAGGKLKIAAIAAPQSDFESAAAAVKLSLDQEVHVTQQINDLVGMAKSEKDYLADNFLQWFVMEQLEEVSTMGALLQTIERAGQTNLLLVEDYLSRQPQEHQ